MIPLWLKILSMLLVVIFIGIISELTKYEEKESGFSTFELLFTVFLIGLMFVF